MPWLLRLHDAILFACASVRAGMCIICLILGLVLSLTTTSSALGNSTASLSINSNIPHQVLLNNPLSNADEKDIHIRIGVLAFRGEALAAQMWSPTVDYLSQAIPGHSFSLVPLNLDTIAVAVRQKQVDFLLTNPASYVALEAQYGVTRIATLRNRRLGQPSTHFGAVIFTRADRADLERLLDLQGQQFVAVHPHAFGGWWMAWGEFKAAGMDPHQDFTLNFTNNTHDAVVESVLAGEYDAGTVRRDLLEQMARDKKIKLSDVKILGLRTEADFPFLLSTRLYPEWAISTLKHVPDMLGHDVAVALLNIPPDSTIARAANSAGWTVPKDYRAVDALMRELKVGHHAHFGEISFQKVLTQYRRELIFLAAVVVLLAMFSVYVAGLNNRLQRSKQDLKEQVRQRESAQEETQKHVVRLRKLYTISAALGANLEAEINRLLRESCELLAMDSGQVNVFDVDAGLISTPFFYHGAGTEVEAVAVNTAEQRIIDSCESVAYVTNEAFAQHDLAQTNAGATQGLNYPIIGAYISVPLWVDQQKYGTVSFYSAAPLAEDFVDADKELVTLLSRWITVAIERNNTVQRDKAEKVAQAASIAREGFIANMSHEMKTPLTAIVGYSEQLLHDVVSAADVDDLLSSILHNAHHATNLINDVLDLSSIDHDSLGVEQAPIELELLLQDVKLLAAPQANQKNLRFSVHNIYPLPKVILSDAILLKKTLLHLIKNAVKFTEQGHITLEVAYNEAARSLSLDIVDTGCGIDQKQLSRIFEPFVRLNTGRSRSHGGTGLGLYLVKHYVEKMGGDVRVSSDLGHGSRFSVLLRGVVTSANSEMLMSPSAKTENPEGQQINGFSPARDRTEESERADEIGSACQQPAKPAQPLEAYKEAYKEPYKAQYKGRVLVAEDNPVNQKIIQRHLERLGLTVVLVENGQQAVESCEIAEFDLILMDIQMPVMDGVEATRLIKKNNASPPPIVAITANGLKEDLQHYKEIGCDGYISKPIDGVRFGKVVSDLLPKASGFGGE